MLNGLWRATVVNNDDSSVKGYEGKGYVQVRVLELHPKDETPDDSQLPWAAPCVQVGYEAMPDIDDEVWVAFEKGEPRSPIWIGKTALAEGIKEALPVEWPAAFRRIISPDKLTQVLVTDDGIKMETPSFEILASEASKTLEVTLADDASLQLEIGDGSAVRIQVDKTQAQITLVGVVLEGTGGLRITGDEVRLAGTTHIIGLAPKIRGFEQHGQW